MWSNRWRAATLTLAVITASLVFTQVFIPTAQAQDSNFKDGVSIALPTTKAAIDSITTTLPAGDNVVIAFVQIFNSNTTTFTNTPAGNLELRRGTGATDPLLAENEFDIWEQRDPEPGNAQTALLIGRDVGAPANPTYTVHASIANAITVNAEVKFLALSGVTSDLADGVAASTATTETEIVGLDTSFAAGTNVIIGVMQLEAGPVVPNFVNPGDLKLRQGRNQAGTILAQNEFHLGIRRIDEQSDGMFAILVALDTAGGASQSYQLTGIADVATSRWEGKLLAFQIGSGMDAASVDTASVAVGTTRTVLGSVATSFPAGDDVLIGVIQTNTTGTVDSEYPATTGLDLARATELDEVVNEFKQRNEKQARPSEGQWWGAASKVTTTVASPTYEGAALRSAETTISAELKLVVVHIKDAAGPCDAITVVTADPAGRLWFNETVEPDGIPFTTQVNVSASFQTGATSALSVTNDGSGTCDITIRLLSSPGVGRSMKFNTTNSAPWPDDASKEVPLDPSSVIACASVASGGTCDIWLWVDYENALAGQASPDVRVETL